jgi:alanine dehydrogenase
MIPEGMPPIYITYLNRLDIEALKITDDEILAAIEGSLATQGRGEAVIEPRVHLEPGVARGHFNVLRGSRWWVISSTTTPGTCRPNSRF